MPSGGGGLLQLVAKGKQDVFLTGNPQMTWFKVAYRRHTNFAIESQAMYFDGTPDFGRRVSCLVPRSGDLLGPLVLELTLPTLTYSSSGLPVKWVNSIGHAIIQEITVQVGEQEIDRQTGEWMEIWSRFTISASQEQGFNNMIGKVDNYNPSSDFQKLYIPLQFWFCRNPGSYLPLIALQYHPVRINITLRPLSECIVPSTDPMLSGQVQTMCSANFQGSTGSISMMLWGDYVYLDTQERRRFVSSAHEYIIEQVQYTQPVSIPAAANTLTIPLEFNNPIKEFFWFIRRDYIATNNEWFNFSSLSTSEMGTRTDLMSNCVILFDGLERFKSRDAGYFRLVQPYQRHTTIPTEAFIYNYSLAISPESFQPSGSVNASRLDSLVFQIALNQNTTPVRGTAHCVIYATNFNVFRAINGFGGILFTA